MKKTERLNGLIFALKEEGRVSAKTLSEMFEVSERTIYRDIDALSQLKVPIIAYEGMGGGYEIDSSYFLPSIQLTEHEAIMVLMLLKLGDQVQFPNLKSDYRVLKSKIINTLDHIDQGKVDLLLDKVFFYLANVIPEAYDKDVLKSLIECFMERKQVIFRYYHPGKNQYTRRRVSPRDLHFDGGAWYLTAYCHLRQEKRIFRLDRMTAVEVSPLANEDDHRVLTSTNDQYRPLVYQLEIEGDLFRVVKDNFFLSHHKILQEGPVMVIEVESSYERHMLHLVLEHPDKITVLQPPHFKDKLMVKIKQLNSKYPI